MKSTVSQLSQLSQSKNTPPEPNTPPGTPAKPPGGWVIWMDTPPVMGPIGTLANEGNSNHVKRAAREEWLG